MRAHMRTGWVGPREAAFGTGDRFYVYRQAVARLVSQDHSAVGDCLVDRQPDRTSEVLNLDRQMVRHRRSGVGDWVGVVSDRTDRQVAAVRDGRYSEKAVSYTHLTLP